MKKAGLLILFPLLLCLTACNVSGSDTETSEEEKEAKVMHVDELITLFEDYRDAHPEQKGKIGFDAMEEAGYKMGDVIELTGYMKQEKHTSGTFNLYGTIGTDDLGYRYYSFSCHARKPLHLLIPVGTEVTVRGTLVMDGGLPWLGDCVFLTPALDEPAYKSNVSDVWEKNGEECVVTGEVMSYEENMISDEEKETLKKKETALSDTMMQTTHKGVLSDGEKEITFFLQKNYIEKLESGDKITVKGVVSKEDGLVYVNAGDAVYEYK